MTAATTGATRQISSHFARLRATTAVPSTASGQNTLAIGFSPTIPPVDRPLSFFQTTQIWLWSIGARPQLFGYDERITLPSPGAATVSSLQWRPSPHSVALCKPPEPIGRDWAKFIGSSPSWQRTIRPASARSSSSPCSLTTSGRHFVVNVMNRWNGSRRIGASIHRRLRFANGC